MSKQPPPFDLGAALRRATQRVQQRTLKTVFRHKTWPGVVALLGEVETRWEGWGRDNPYWIGLRVLKGRAERLAENPAVPQGDRDRARRVCVLVDDLIRLAWPQEGIYNLSMIGLKYVRVHLERLDKAGCELREAAEILELADSEKPIYVPFTYVFGKHAEKVRRATDRAIMRCLRQSKAAEAAVKHGRRQPLTPDAAAAKSSNVPKCVAMAFDSYLWVCETRPGLVPSAGRQRYSEALYKHVKENAPQYTKAEPCPTIGTWTRYVRECELLTGSPKTALRALRSGRSIVGRQGI